MTPPSSPNDHKEFNSEKNQPHITPSYDIYGEHFSEILEEQVNEESDNKRDDWDSFGDLILFI